MTSRVCPEGATLNPVARMPAAAASSAMVGQLPVGAFTRIPPGRSTPSDRVPVLS